MFESVLDPILSPLLGMTPVWAILIISLVISVLITVVYKYMTNQELMKSLKQELKGMQKEMKTSKDNPKRMMEIQKKSMEKNMKYMTHSMKPTLVTLLPIIIIFGWLNTHMGFYPIIPGQDFTTTIDFKEGVYGNASLELPDSITSLEDLTKEIENDKVMWTLNAEFEGEYILQYAFNGRLQEKEIVISNERVYKTPVMKVKDSNIKTITVNHEKVIALNLFGWKIGWLGTYIIFSLIFSMGLRKILKIH